MAKGIELILFKGTQGYDISDLVIQIKWAGRKGSSSRTVEATLLDDEARASSRAGINVEEGQQIIFSLDGQELHQGIIMSQKHTEKKQLTFKAYDNGIYLANNKDTFVYSNKSASHIFRDICKRFGLPTSTVTETVYKIPELVKPKTTAFDALCDALSQTFRAKGHRYYIDSKKGKLRLLKRKENILQWVLEIGQNIISYNSTVSIEKVKTRIKLLSDEGTVLAEKKDTELEKKIGIMQDVDEPDETLNSAQLDELVAAMLDESKQPERSLKLTTLGIPDVVSGVGVVVIIPALGISKTFYVDEDTHIFKDNYHTMSLTLNYAFDAEDAFTQKEKSKSTGSGSGSTDSKGDSYGGFSVGDTVYFNGGDQYATSGSYSPVGSKRTAGPAKITRIAKDAKHPYHLVGGKYNSLGGDCNAYGWFDAGTFTKEG
ncbi:MAG: hypothetical protein IJX94_01425 [Clostridia bacterium]|nr:hypothetical protein [Clostridia bacterium]